MGVVNVTPDSFSDGGDFFDPEKAFHHALQLQKDGADILDIGGESTRPGADPVTPEEEQARVIPVIQAIKKASPEAIISIDTRHSSTMIQAINNGANIINDVSALTNDPQSLDVVLEAQIPVILMHMKGDPQSMQKKPEYNDVVQEIFDYLKERISVCVNAGIHQDNIIIDPGIGFGKTLDNNLDILERIDYFHDLGCSLLLGASRKSFIEKICPETPADQRLAGSIAAAIQGLQKKVQIFRVHDVKETRQAFDVWQAIHKQR